MNIIIVLLMVIIYLLWTKGGVSVKKEESIIKIKKEETIMSIETIDQIANHLEFLGYEVTKNYDDQNKSLDCRHASLRNLFVHTNGNGFHFFKSGNTTTNKYCIEMDVYLNKINADLIITRAYREQDTNPKVAITLEAIYIGEYSKKIFGQFCQAFEEDFQKIKSGDDFDKIFLD